MAGNYSSCAASKSWSASGQATDNPYLDFVAPAVYLLELCQGHHGSGAPLSRVSRQHQRHNVVIYK